jgi:membrane associated rhomboid family serine protease
MASETMTLPTTVTRLRSAAMTIAVGLTLLLVFLYQSGLPQPDHDLFILRWAAVPMEVTEATDLEPHVPFPIAGTLTTSIFLHAGWLHLVGNLLLLGLFAPLYERAAGPWATLGVFVVGGTLGAAAQAYAHPDSLVNLVGASGGCAALMGAALVAARTPLALKMVFVAWLTIQIAEFASGFDRYDWIEGGMAVWSHAGGLAVGLLAGALTALVGARSRRRLGAG